MRTLPRRLLPYFIWHLLSPLDALPRTALPHRSSRRQLCVRSCCRTSTRTAAFHRLVQANGARKPCIPALSAGNWRDNGRIWKLNELVSAIMALRWLTSTRERYRSSPVVSGHFAKADDVRKVGFPCTRSTLCWGIFIPFFWSAPGLIFLRQLFGETSPQALALRSVSFSAMPSHWLTNPKYSLSLSSIGRVSRPDNSTTGFTFN